jgi:hypothetical protein
MPKVFISYSRADAPAEMLIADILRGKGMEVVEDRDVLVSGRQFEHNIDSAIREADAVVVLLSANSERSTWVENELVTALEKNDVIPVLLDEEAKNNRIWPLIADRNAIELKKAGSLKIVHNK